jgi:hypothetical protein
LADTSFVGYRALAQSAALLAATLAATVALATAPPAEGAGKRFKIGNGHVAFGWSALAFAPMDLAAISGESFEDSDGDGARDAGEPGVEGFSVYLDLDGDGVRDGGEPLAVSGADGGWRFGGLAPGRYRVRQSRRDGWTCSAPTGCGREVELAGADVSGRDFGAWRAGRILGRVFQDVNRNGERDEGEPAQARRTLYVDKDGDSTHDADEPSATSGVDGSYSLDWLRPGDWVVREALPEGWSCSMPNPCSHTVELRSFAEVAYRDFGSFYEPIPETPVPPDPPDPPSPPLPPAPPASPPPPAIGTPSLSHAVPDGAVDPTIDRDRDPTTGANIYLVSRAEQCLPLRLDVPIQAEPGTALDVRVVLRPADGADEQTVVLADGPPEPADGVWSGPIGCARDGQLELIVETEAGMIRAPVGEVVLIDPTGTIYDQKLYRELLADGEDPETARCGSALRGATVTLQRRVEERFLTADGTAMAPNVETQLSDADGGYRWNLAPGEYRVRVAKRGYHPAVSRVVSVAAPVLDLHVGMKPRRGTPAPLRTCANTRPPVIDAPEGCLMRPVNARVRGRHIRRVVFHLDGRRLETVSRPDRRGRFGVTVHRRTLAPGKHVLRAKVVFVRRAKRRPAFLTLRIQRCVANSKPKLVEAARRPGCATKPFLAWVRGDRIRRVRFRLDGRTLRSVAVADWRGRYGARIDPARLRNGSHVVNARIEFVTTSGLRTRTVRLRFTKCP